MKARFSLRASKRSTTIGMDKWKVFLISMPFFTLEFLVAMYALVFGFSVFSIVFLMCNFGLCLGSLCYLMFQDSNTHQVGGWMEVSNYNNLNKLGKDK